MKIYVSKLCFAFFIFFNFSLSATSIDLFEVISWEDETEFKKAVDSGGNVNQIDSDQNISILMKAIETMKPNLVQVLLDKETNVNLKMPGTKKNGSYAFYGKIHSKSRNRWKWCFYL